MVEVVWTDPALSDLDAIADYIALENYDAARRLVQRIFNHVDTLVDHPEIGSIPNELEGWPYREIVEPPVRVFYRREDQKVYVVHVMRTERQLRIGLLERGFGRDS